jgi:hypothetical protein
VSGRGVVEDSGKVELWISNLNEICLTFNGEEVHLCPDKAMELADKLTELADEARTGIPNSAGNTTRPKPN